LAVVDPGHAATTIFDQVLLDRSSSDARIESALAAGLRGRGGAPNAPGAVTSAFGLY
jgi:hypothetical protein